MATQVSAKQPNLLTCPFFAKVAKLNREKGESSVESRSGVAVPADQRRGNQRQTYPGNSQRLVEVLSPDQPEAPRSGTLHHDPHRHS